MKSFMVIGNIVFSGFMTFLITMFYAGGTIAENYTDKTFVAPEFFVTVPICWAIGAIMIWRYSTKHSLKDMSFIMIVLINFALWLSIPIGIQLGFAINQS
jgi:hypothetical protein